MKHIAGVGRIVIRIGRAVVGLHQRQPVDKHSLFDLQKVAHIESIHYFETERDERSLVGEPLESDYVKIPCYFGLEQLCHLRCQVFDVVMAK